MSEVYYGAPNDFRGYLAHHGIKGQKWGVRNGPPYPLDVSDHSAAEKKAAKGDSKKLSTSTSDISKKKATHSKSSILRNIKVAGGMPSLQKKGGTVKVNPNHFVIHDNNKIAEVSKNKVTSKVNDYISVIKEFNSSNEYNHKKDLADKANKLVDELEQQIKQDIIHTSNYKNYVKAANEGQKILRQMYKTNNSNFDDSGYAKASNDMTENVKTLANYYLSGMPNNFEKNQMIADIIISTMQERKEYIPMH